MGPIIINPNGSSGRSSVTFLDHMGFSLLSVVYAIHAQRTEHKQAIMDTPGNISFATRVLYFIMYPPFYCSYHKSADIPTIITSKLGYPTYTAFWNLRHHLAERMFPSSMTDSGHAWARNQKYDVCFCLPCLKRRHKGTST